MVKFIGRRDLLYVRKQQRMAFFRQAFFGIPVSPKVGAVIVAVYEYCSLFIILFAKEIGKQFVDKVIYGEEVVEVKVSKKNVSDLEKSFAMWTMVDRTFVLITNTCMLVGVLAHQGILLWPFILWGVPQTIVNVVISVVMAAEVSKRSMAFMTLVSLDAYALPVVYSALKVMYVEDVVEARFNDLIIREEHRRIRLEKLKHEKRKAFEAIIADADEKQETTRPT